MLHADVTLLDAGDERDAVETALTEKYAGFRTEDAQLPDATREHYAVESAVLRLTPGRAPGHLGQQQAALRADRG